MAYTHFEVDETLKPARDLMDTLRTLRSAWQNFTAVRGCLLQQLDDVAGKPTDLASVAKNYGYKGASADAQMENAKASFAEIDSAFGSGNAAIVQMLDRHLTK